MSLSAWLTLHVDSDPGGDGEGEVVVAGLAGQLSAELGAWEVLDAEAVLDGAAVAALVARVDQVAVAPPRHLRQGVAWNEAENEIYCSALLQVITIYRFSK